MDLLERLNSQADCVLLFFFFWVKKTGECNFKPYFLNLSNDVLFSAKVCLTRGKHSFRLHIGITNSVVNLSSKYFFTRKYQVESERRTDTAVCVWTYICCIFHLPSIAAGKGDTLMLLKMTKKVNMSHSYKRF